MDRSTYPVEIAIAVLVFIGVIYIGRNAATAREEAPASTAPAVERTTIDMGRPADGPRMRDLDFPRD